MPGSHNLARTVALLVLLLLGQGWSSPAQALTLDRCKGYSASGDLDCTVTPHNITPWLDHIPGPIKATPRLPSADEAIAAYKPILTATATLCGGMSASVGGVDTTWYLYGPSRWNFRSGLYLQERYPVTFRDEVRLGMGTPTSPYSCSPRGVTTLLYRFRQATCDYAAGWMQGNDDPATLFCAVGQNYEDRSCPAGNPVLPGSGVKVHNEADYAGAGAHPLQWSRAYRSRWAVAALSGSLGLNTRSGGAVGWLHNYERQLREVTGAPVPQRRTFRPDGSVVTFTSRADAQGVMRWQAEPGAYDQLNEIRDLTNTLVGWRLVLRADDSTEHYGAAGRLQSITERNGWTTTLLYSDATTPVDVAPAAGLLIRVTNHFGRALQLRYDVQRRLAALIDPGGGAIGYGYDAIGNLETVTWQDGAVKRYHHEDSRWPSHLTGITDEAGVRIGTYAYDAQGRAISTEQAGGANRLSFSYSIVGKQTYVRDSANVSRSYGFTNTAGVLRSAAVSAPCEVCGRTQKSTAYDAQANKLKEVAHDGSVTFYQYDASGRETERATFAASYQSATTRPALSIATKVVSTQRHATFNVPTEVAEPNKTTSNVYDDKGMLTEQSWTATTDATGAAKFGAVKTGSTYATAWSYGASSLERTLLEKVDGSVIANVRLDYDSYGSPVNATNLVTGEMATLTFDLHGRVLESPQQATSAAPSSQPKLTLELLSIGFNAKAEAPIFDVKKVCQPLKLPTEPEKCLTEEQCWDKARKALPRATRATGARSVRGTVGLHPLLGILPVPVSRPRRGHEVRMQFLKVAKHETEEQFDNRRWIDVRVCNHRCAGRCCLSQSTDE